MLKRHAGAGFVFLAARRAAVVERGLIELVTDRAVTAAGICRGVVVPSMVTSKVGYRTEHHAAKRGERQMAG